MSPYPVTIPNITLSYDQGNMEEIPHSLGGRLSTDVETGHPRVSRQDSRNQLTISGSRDNSLTALPRIPSFTSTPKFASRMRLKPLGGYRRPRKVKATHTDTAMARLVNTVKGQPSSRWTSKKGASSATAPKRVSFPVGSPVYEKKSGIELRQRPKSMNELDGMLESLSTQPKDPAAQASDKEENDIELIHAEDEQEHYETQLSYSDRTDAELSAWRERLEAEIHVVDSELKLRKAIDEVDSPTASPVAKRNSRISTLDYKTQAINNREETNSGAESTWVGCKNLAANIWKKVTGRNEKPLHISAPTNISKQPWPDHIQRAYTNAGVVAGSV